MSRTATILSALIVAVCGMSVSPRTPSSPWRDVLNLNVNESDGIGEAARKGDAHALELISAQANIDAERSLAKAMLYRVTGSLASSDAFAQRCLAEAAAGSEAVQAVSGFLCSEVLAGNRFLARDYPGWARHLMYGVAVTKKAFDARYGTRPYSFASLNGLDLATVAHVPPTPIGGDVAAGGVLSRLLPIFADGKTELRYDEKGAAPPWIAKVMVNGKPVAMRVDSGAVVSNLNVKSARESNVRILAPTFLPLGVGSSGQITSSSLGQIDNLSVGSIGSLTWQTAVSDVPDVLGSDFLRALRVFRIEERKLTVLDPKEAPVCGAPLRFASDWQGQHLLVATMKVDGADRSVLVDTGNDTPLSIYEPNGASADDPLMTERTLAGTRDVHYRKDEATVEGQRIPTLRIAAPSGFPFDYVLGAAALRYISLTFNFDSMRLCVGRASRSAH